EARRHIERAVNASKRMEAFLQTARKQLDSQDRKQLFSTNREVADAVGLLTHKSLKACVVIRIKSAGDIEIIGNPVKFFQVAVNLISNAIDAYHDTAPSVEKPVIASIASADGYVRFSVEDRGVGIREDLKQAIFQPFFTTKRDRSIHEAGFGLGLSTTKEIVERDFGGTIEVESVLGKGSRFTVIIPTAPAHARTARTDLPVDRAGP
ncbi:MAG: HAMP domain-containing histidine kinase, partial [Patescibacteria group bacterium]|nr:HAMP domain-containing histidine kinase [Patescibacteria group bacterium]